MPKLTIATMQKDNSRSHSFLLSLSLTSQKSTLPSFSTLSCSLQSHTSRSPGLWVPPRPFSQAGFDKSVLCGYLGWGGMGWVGLRPLNVFAGWVSAAAVIPAMPLFLPCPPSN